MMLSLAITRELPKKRARPEDELQMAIIDHLRFRAAPGVVFHSVPNEAKRSPRLGARMKRMGLRPGAGDILLALPPTARAANLEVKNGKDGRQTPEQKQFERDIVACGGLYAIARTIDEATSILKTWGAIR